MSKRAAHQRFVQWLAFTAMALIVLMPAISRSMPADMGIDNMASMSVDCPMSTTSANHRHHHVIPGDPSDPTARCSYCVLMTHNPVTGFASVLLWLPVELHADAPQVLTARGAAFAPLLSAPPRGPPLGING